VANDVNKAVWDFLKAQQLEDDPEWEEYKTR